MFCIITVSAPGPWKNTQKNELEMGVLPVSSHFPKVQMFLLLGIPFPVAGFLPATGKADAKQYHHQ
jgi:hypothetical protein